MFPFLSLFNTIAHLTNPYIQLAFNLNNLILGLQSTDKNDWKYGLSGDNIKKKKPANGNVRELAEKIGLIRRDMQKLSGDSFIADNSSTCLGVKNYVRDEKRFDSATKI